jgi:hypothetical protein
MLTLASFHLISHAIGAVAYNFSTEAVGLRSVPDQSLKPAWTSREESRMGRNDERLYTYRRVLHQRQAYSELTTMTNTLSVMRSEGLQEQLMQLRNSPLNVFRMYQSPGTTSALTPPGIIHASTPVTAHISNTPNVSSVLHTPKSFYQREREYCYGSTER